MFGGVGPDLLGPGSPGLSPYMSVDQTFIGFIIIITNYRYD